MCLDYVSLFWIGFGLCFELVWPCAVQEWRLTQCSISLRLQRQQTGPATGTAPARALTPLHAAEMSQSVTLSVTETVHHADPRQRGAVASRSRRPAPGGGRGSSATGIQVE